MTGPAPDPVAAAQHFLAGCVGAGLRRIILSPGSRSTPLAVAATTAGIPWAMHLDERSAAFSALGESKVTGEPVALICTSGTAAANYLPAIAEAGMSDVPIVVITADRPPEHIGWGVGQAFDQTGLYAAHVRREYRMPVGGDGGVHHALRAGARAVGAARSDRGPVHVNWPFRLPVEPTSAPIDIVDSVETGTTTPAAADPIEQARFERLIDASERPVIVAGPDAVPQGADRPSAARKVLDFATGAGVPVIADVLSGLRGQGVDAPVVDAAPHLLAGGSAPEPDLVIRLGDTPTAKSVRLWWEAQTAAQVLLDPNGRWQDPSHRVTDHFRSSLWALAPHPPAGRVASSDWADRWVELGRDARRTVDRVLDESSTETEAHLARALGRSTDPGDVVVASSSMPVRDLDSFVPVTSSTPVLSNRGINGIDGVVATAIGVGRGVPGSRIVVHIGDIALLHDLGSVLDATRQRAPLTIVVPNNDGGGIFSFLPIRTALDEPTYERLFHTPHGTDLGFLAGHEEIDHRRLSVAELESELRRPRSELVSVLEVRVSTPEHVAIHERLGAAIRDAIR